MCEPAVEVEDAPPAGEVCAEQFCPRNWEGTTGGAAIDRAPAAAEHLTGAPAACSFCTCEYPPMAASGVVHIYDGVCDAALTGADGVCDAGAGGVGGECAASGNVCIGGMCVAPDALWDDGVALDAANGVALDAANGVALDAADGVALDANEQGAADE